MYNNQKFQQSNDIESEIAEYRDKQRKKYLNQKKGISTDRSLSCSSSSNQVDTSLSVSKVNCSNNLKINCSTSSSEAHENSNHEVNNPNSRYNNEFDCNLTDSLELDIDRNKQIIQRDKINDKANESIENFSPDCVAQNANGLSANKSKTNKSRNPKKSTSNSSSGIISSLKSWTHSLITHSSKQNSQNRRQRSSRNMDSSVNMENTSIEGFRGLSQIENNDSDILRTEISDEELARRIQMEELNSLGALHIAENNPNLPLYSIGSFQDANYCPNVTFPSSNSTPVCPFQGVPYKFEFRSSDDEQ